MPSIHQWEKIYAAEGPVFLEPFPRFPEVVQAFNDHRCRKIIDLGCGSGRHTAALAAAGFHTTGLDISPTGLKLTQQLLAKHPGITGPINTAPQPPTPSPQPPAPSLVQSDLLHPLPFRDASFHGLLSTQVIHHALKAQVLSIIDEIHRILVPGGLAIVSVAGRIHDDDEYDEIEPNTFLPLTGSEAGLPHHIFDEETYAQAFSAFHIHFIDRRDSGRVLMIQAQK